MRFCQVGLALLGCLASTLLPTVAQAVPSYGGGNCNSCHTASSPAMSVTPSPNPISIQKSKTGLLTLQIDSLGVSSSAVLSVQGLENAALNTTVAPRGGGHWTYTTGSKGSSWLSDSITSTGPYTMNISIGTAAVLNTYPITVRLAGTSRKGTSTSFNLTILPAAVPGDYNGNEVVDAADYVLWRNGGPLQNEVDTPGTINEADYTEWRARYGNTVGSGMNFEIRPIPEATTCVLAGAALALASFARRR